jgi:hypothetical protein
VADDLGPELVGADRRVGDGRRGEQFEFRSRSPGSEDVAVFAADGAVALGDVGRVDVEGGAIADVGAVAAPRVRPFRAGGRYGCVRVAAAVISVCNVMKWVVQLLDRCVLSTVQQIWEAAPLCIHWRASFLRMMVRKFGGTYLLAFIVSSRLIFSYEDLDTVGV